MEPLSVELVRYSLFTFVESTPSHYTVPDIGYRPLQPEAIPTSWIASQAQCQDADSPQTEARPAA
jgi:hypothetical protein